MRIRVEHDIHDLSSDLAAIPVQMAPKLAGAVRRNVTRGRSEARRIARKASGPHGKNYYKRITSEMTGPFEGEYGPEGDVLGNAVGGGWRNGPPNTDLEKSLDMVGPKFAKDVGDALDSLFWP